MNTGDGRRLVLDRDGDQLRGAGMNLFQQIRDLVPGILALREQLRADGFHPSAVVLPSDLEPVDRIPNTPAFAMGLPIVWGDRAGLVLSVGEVSVDASRRQPSRIEMRRLRCTSCDELIMPFEDSLPDGSVDADDRWMHRDCAEAGE